MRWAQPVDNLVRVLCRAVFPEPAQAVASASIPRYDLSQGGLQAPAPSENDHLVKFPATCSYNPFYKAGIIATDLKRTHSICFFFLPKDKPPTFLRGSGVWCISLTMT